MSDPGNFRSKWLQRSALLLSSLFALWALAWLLVPMVLKHQLETRLGAQLGREVRVGQVDFKPWSLELTLHDLQIAQADAQPGTPPQLSVQRLYLDLEAQSLLRLAPVVDALQIDAPQLRLRHLGAGRYDVDDILARLQPAPDAPPTAAPHFALYNLALNQGAVMLEDAAKGQSHHLQALSIQLPFLSNLPTHREVKVQPRLSFQLNGSRFDSGAQGTPFAQVHQSEASFSVQRLDLAPYLAYWPAALAIRPTAAVIDADLRLRFEQAAQPSLSLSGQVHVSNVQLVIPAQPTPRPALAFEKLSVQLSDVRPLQRQVKLGGVEWRKPVWQLHRNAQASLNWQRLLDAPRAGGPAIDKRAPQAEQKSAKSQKDAKAEGWQIELAQFKTSAGELHWLDQTTAAPAVATLHGLDLSVQALHWPLRQSVPFEGQGQIDRAALRFKGQANAQQAELSAQLKQLPLALAAPYLAGHLAPHLSGLLSVDLGLDWAAPSAPGAPMKLVLRLPELALEQVALHEAQGSAVSKATALASIQKLRMTRAELDLSAQQAKLGELQLSRVRAAVSRQADGRWMFQDWLKGAATPEPAPQATAARPWSLRLQQLKLEDSHLEFSDAVPAQPVTVSMQGVNLQLKDWSSDGAKPFGWVLAARMRHEQGEPAVLQAQGQASVAPLMLRATVSAQQVPLLALAPYAGERLNLRLRSGRASYSGRVDLAQQPAGLGTRLGGDLLLHDLRLDTLARPDRPAEELLSWRELQLRGLDLALAPDTAAQVTVGQTRLSDFFAKLTLSESGRLNLQEVQEATPSSPSGASESGAVSAINTGATGQNDAKTQAAPVVHFGPLQLVNGHIDFHDRFIKPNYSARLTELSGSLGGFSSQPVNGAVQLAELTLRGRAEGSATLDISGQLNPLATPLALDLKARVRDLELAPLSPYSARYAGYGIERGKLSVDLHYKVAPDGQLSADHGIVLNQLKFGDAVPGAENSLPVKLAVALLADRQGVIDINLPVSGSLNDPQFRIAPIVFKLIGNLILKAVTAPFSLLASALGGGGDELSRVAFAPGSAALGPAARAQLERVAQALAARPALKMTVVGSASLPTEADAYRRQQLNSLLLAERRRKQAGGASDNSVITDPQYPELLKAVYRQADLAKPRNLIGLAKDLPVPEMEALLLAQMPATESHMQALALQRGVAVRDHLASLKLPMTRLFLGAPKAASQPANWQPQAELNLATD